jgi:hypothetical protein
MKNKFENVFVVLGEGGGLTISRVTKNGKTSFLYNHQEFDPKDEGLEINIKEFYSNFEEPFELINKYPWHLLFVEKVHEDFVDYVSEKLVEKLDNEGSKYEFVIEEISQLTSLLKIELTEKDGNWEYQPLNKKVKTNTMTTDLKWKDAIAKILEEEKKALHYAEIADLISERGYRKSLGATPKDTVSSCLTTDIKSHKEKSIFVKVDRGIFILRKFLDDGSQLLSEEESEIQTAEKIYEQETPGENKKVINAFGIYWNRNLVYWKTTPELLGIQQTGATEVNFKDQRGIYLLYDNREIIYVGQAIEQTLGQRLKQHISDRLSGRWDRFSWFGFYSVSDKGHLLDRKKFESLDIQVLADIIEAILIESIEPRQNRKQGNTLLGMEYLQKESSEIKKKKTEELIKELTSKL